MGKRLSVEDKLARLTELRGDPRAPGVNEELAACLRGKSNVVTAAAARIAADFRLTNLVPELLDAFGRLLVHGEITDKRCEAKISIAKALLAMETSTPEAFLPGIRHFQMEPVWGGREDTAVELRAVSILALVDSGYPEALAEAVDLLADPEPRVRATAARAIANSGRREGALALRLKVLTGDAVPQVMGDCFAALLWLEPGRSLPLVARYLHSADDALAESAALALGESKLEGAFEILKARLDEPPPMRRALCAAIALLRRDEAVDFLLDRAGASPEARAALEIYAADERVQAKLRCIMTPCEPPGGDS